MFLARRAQTLQHEVGRDPRSNEGGNRVPSGAVEGPLVKKVPVGFWFAPRANWCIDIDVFILY